ncbi:hypothetical protein MG293_009404 [Ovis ammon polii]|uniref:Uncharacterized protein n=1 Tax=Ovis ammon polii TaxID=230172 RepID=A0AAD4U4Q2_OVIAM|nr:hypothetical protein MG293_009404 [Ovis ammon polii]
MSCVSPSPAMSRKLALLALALLPSAAKVPGDGKVHTEREKSSPDSMLSVSAPEGWICLHSCRDRTERKPNVTLSHSNRPSSSNPASYQGIFSGPTPNSRRGDSPLDILHRGLAMLLETHDPALFLLITISVCQLQKKQTGMEEREPDMEFEDLWEKTLRDWKKEYLGEAGPRLLEKDMETTTKYGGHSTEDIPMQAITQRSFFLLKLHSINKHFEATLCMSSFDREDILDTGPNLTIINSDLKHVLCYVYDSFPDVHQYVANHANLWKTRHGGEKYVREWKGLDTGCGSDPLRVASCGTCSQGERPEQMTEASCSKDQKDRSCQQRAPQTLKCEAHATCGN